MTKETDTGYGTIGSLLQISSFVLMVVAIVASTKTFGVDPLISAIVINGCSLVYFYYAMRGFAASQLIGILFLIISSLLAAAMFLAQGLGSLGGNSLVSQSGLDAMMWAGLALIAISILGIYVSARSRKGETPSSSAMYIAIGLGVVPLLVNLYFLLTNT